MPKRRIYSVQRHDATTLHYDLRLEHKGVLLSWAIPKEPKDDGAKRLAIQTDDHPLSYAKFEGIIPEGSYGAGTVKLWDSGTWEPEEATSTKIVANINGKKLNGKFILVKMKGKQWLFFKAKEQ